MICAVIIIKAFIFKLPNSWVTDTPAKQAPIICHFWNVHIILTPVYTHKEEENIHWKKKKIIKIVNFLFYSTLSSKEELRHLGQVLVQFRYAELVREKLENYTHFMMV